MARGGNRGRGSKLNDDRADAIVRMIGAGHNLVSAAAAAGISETTFHNWMRRGRESSSGKYFDFMKRIKEAEAKAEIAILEKIKEHGDRQWQAYAWIMERRYPKNWAQQTRVRMQVEKELDQVLDFMKERLTPELYDAFTREIVASQAGLRTAEGVETELEFE